MQEFFSIDNHQALFVETVYKLGKIHYIISKSAQTLYKLSYEKPPDTGFTIHETTEFGHEVASDEIFWWVNKKEQDLPTLLKNTKDILKKIDKLKHDADKFKESFSSEEYSSLIDKIKQFIDNHKTEISSLYDYAVWLESKDPLAPSMLLNYRCWGSSMMAERKLSIPDNDDLSEQILKKSTQIAVGVSTNYGYTANEAYAHATDFGGKNVSIETIRLQISFDVREKFHQFIENLRRSIQNIILEIEKIDRSYELLNSKQFWAKNIRRIMDIPVEDQLWDLKQTLEIWQSAHGNKEQAKFEFCEDIAAFANADGGVLIIGISDEKPRRIYDIESIEDRLKVTKELIQEKITYDEHFTFFIPFTVEDETEKNCLIIGVAQTKKAVSVLTPDNTFSWPVRIETGKKRSDEETINKRKKKVARDNVDFMLLLEKDLS